MWTELRALRTGAQMERGCINSEESSLRTDLLGCALLAEGAGLDSEVEAAAGGEAGDEALPAPPPAPPARVSEVVTAASGALRRTRRALCSISSCDVGFEQSKDEGHERNERLSCHAALLSCRVVSCHILLCQDA